MVGLGPVGSFDVQAACSGFIYAVSIATQFIATGQCRKVVVVGADKMSPIIDYTDRATCVIFGDGAGAVLVEPSPNGEGILDTLIRSDGSGMIHLHQKAGGSRLPPTRRPSPSACTTSIRKAPRFTNSRSRRWPRSRHEIMARNNLRADMIHWLVPHQANRRIIESTAERMGLPMDRVMVTIQKYGNTTAATIPLCLWDYEERLKTGDRMILAAFGGGFTWGASVSDLGL